MITPRSWRSRAHLHSSHRIRHPHGRTVRRNFPQSANHSTCLQIRVHGSLVLRHHHDGHSGLHNHPRSRSMPQPSLPSTASRPTVLSRSDLSSVYSDSASRLATQMGVGWGCVTVDDTVEPRLH
ncbi:hypothetical protein M427DRAFT_335031 [Gonapodya prolifera JEL478]|uniref:Uncharacterized protein n=1 Tax=Gonapodya prolifera (strain JEL478) TaxID=1344416 RepID=A0A139ADD4_GONPJ|nr:hypothetical protein M427DRAFT_335031 [Gonapodya prolifera JEL478]|eukprot:KXS14836.1 hypothetical protein M427DRAFT_335031 [Gonapodya prolifera JEL478]